MSNNASFHNRNVNTCNIGSSVRHVNILFFAPYQCLIYLSRFSSLMQTLQTHDAGYRDTILNMSRIILFFVSRGPAGPVRCLDNAQVGRSPTRHRYLPEWYPVFLSYQYNSVGSRISAIDLFINIILSNIILQLLIWNVISWYFYLHDWLYLNISSIECILSTYHCYIP